MGLSIFPRMLWSFKKSWGLPSIFKLSEQIYYIDWYFNWYVKWIYDIFNHIYRSTIGIFKISLFFTVVCVYRLLPSPVGQWCSLQAEDCGGGLCQETEESDMENCWTETRLLFCCFWTCVCFFFFPYFWNITFFICFINDP